VSLDVYPTFQLVSSLVIVTLFGAHALFSARRRVRYHDDRSAADLLIALTLTIASLGLLLSASATFIGSDVAQRSDMRNAGLAIVRGVLIVTAIVMVAANRARVPLR
jgi:hypothetical protein